MRHSAEAFAQFNQPTTESKNRKQKMNKSQSRSHKNSGKTQNRGEYYAVKNSAMGKNLYGSLSFYDKSWHRIMKQGYETGVSLLAIDSNVR